MFRRITALAGGVILAAAMALAGATWANAATPQCTAVLGNACGSWNAEVPGLPDLDVLGGAAVSGNSLIVFTRSATDKAEDFIIVHVNPAAVSKYDVTGGLHNYTQGVTTPLPGSVAIEYAPKGVPSGYFVSSVNPNGFAATQLRAGSNNVTQFNPYQAFVEKDTGNPGDGQFVTFAESVNNHLLTDPRNGGSIGAVGARVHVTTSGGNGTTIRTGQLWGQNGA
jgi:hypothetical protein